MAKKQNNPKIIHIASLGGQALLKKRGKQHFKDMINARWAKHREENPKLEKK
jgi:hypothetical protein